MSETDDKAAPAGSAVSVTAGESAEPELAAIFRREALEHRARPQQEGHVLELSPAWIGLTYAMLVAVCTVALLYICIGRLNEYASGTAIIVRDGRVDLTARVAGTVSAIDAQPGQRVAKGTVLVRLYSALEAAELDRIEHEFELQLIKTLRDPGDTTARSTLTSLRAQRDLARARLEERTLRAPQDGVVSDLRIRVGQQLGPGDLMLSLVGGAASFRVIAMLPGQYRPLLRPGMPLRLELLGYAYAYQALTVEKVGDEVVGPAEVRRYLRQSAADIFTPQGPLVLVEARMPTRYFVANDRQLDYYEGMQAKADVPVRSERIVVTLVPGLKALWSELEGGPW